MSAAHGDRVLVDTHVVLWALTAPEKLGASARETLRAGSTQVLYSSVTTTELAVKLALGKLILPVPLAELVAGLFREEGFTGLPYTHEHALELGRLPPHHRDPFDRMLIAQARVEGVPLVTADRVLHRYDVPILW